MGFSFFGVIFAAFASLGGLLGSTLSCILLAELAVGRIIRARKPSSRGAREDAVLIRDLGRSGMECVASQVVSGLRVDGLRESVLAVSVLGELRKLMWLCERARDPVLAADAAVGVTREAGRRTGRVGDFEAGLLWGDGCMVGFFMAS